MIARKWHQAVRRISTCLLFSVVFAIAIPRLGKAQLYVCLYDDGTSVCAEGQDDEGIWCEDLTGCYGTCDDSPPETIIFQANCYDVGAAAQAQTAAPNFEAASVRTSNGGTRGPSDGLKTGGPGTADPGRIVYRNAPFARLLTDAYGVPLNQISGPDWATKIVGTDAHYDIQATIPSGADPQQLASMLQKLLAERFRLAVHHQTKQVTGYSLVVARSGPKIKESRGPVADNEYGAMDSTGRYKLNTSNLEADGFPRLWPGGPVGTNFGASNISGVIRMRLRDYTLGQLADQLSVILAARINDGTALGGKYDFTLEFFPPDYGIARIRAMMPTPQDRNLIFINEPDDSQLACASILSSALEKQLGLRIEAKKVTVDLLVVDHVDKSPVEN